MQGLESKSPQYNLTRDSALIVRLKPTNLDNILWTGYIIKSYYYIKHTTSYFIDGSWYSTYF